MSVALLLSHALTSMLDRACTHMQAPVSACNLLKPLRQRPTCIFHNTLQKCTRSQMGNTAQPRL